jgi:subtilase family serine protease
VESHRGAPDISFDANPSTGVWVYDSTFCHGSSGWMIFGGTSVSSPALAGIINLAGSFSYDSPTELTKLYSVYGPSSANSCTDNDFRDITSGSAGSFSAGNGWDFVTGIGSVQGPACK